MAHYFTESPDSPDIRRTISAPLAGSLRSVETSSGIFSPEHLDLGTAQLLRSAGDLPDSGVFVDLGCGWGPIALDMALQRPDATVWAIDVNRRALEITKRNAERLGVRLSVGTPEEALSEIHRIDVLRSNPPIRIGKTALHDLLRLWLGRLAEDGVAELVVSKNLGARSLAAWICQDLGFDCYKVASRKGFVTLRAQRND